MAPLFQVQFFFPDKTTHRTWLPFIPEIGQTLSRSGQSLTVATCDYNLDLHFFCVTFAEVPDARTENSQSSRRGRSPRAEMPSVQTQSELGQLDPKKKH